MNEIDEIQLYTKRLKQEYEELLGYREGIKKQIELDEKELKELQKEKENIVSEITVEIKIANNVLEGIRGERENYNDRFIGRERAINASLINIEEKEIQLDRELENYSRTKYSYNIAREALVGERKKIEEERIQMEVEKRMIAKIMEDELAKVDELNKIKDSLEAKKIKENRIIKGLKIKGLKLAQKGEATMKTNEFLISKAEALEKERLHIESRQRQIKSALDKLKQREAQTNGRT